jgi:hypothetical protein
MNDGAGCFLYPAYRQSGAREKAEPDIGMRKALLMALMAGIIERCAPVRGDVVVT